MRTFKLSTGKEMFFVGGFTEDATNEELVSLYAWRFSLDFLRMLHPRNVYGRYYFSDPIKRRRARRRLFKVMPEINRLIKNCQITDKNLATLLEPVLKEVEDPNYLVKNALEDIRNRLSVRSGVI